MRSAGTTEVSVCTTWRLDGEGFGGKPEGKRLLGRLRRRWEDNINMDLREIVWCGMDWIILAEDTDQRRALVNTVMNIRVP
jgi:hypothetical protein